MFKKISLLLLIASVFENGDAGPTRNNIFKKLDAASGREEAKCGYKSCNTPVPGMLNVHLVPHTHDDVGWLKTVDQYYYGSKNTIQKAGVQYILDSVIQELVTDPEKKFIYVESAFFFKWWKQQKPELQEEVKKLVEEGRLEFIGGAWSMNDEAATHYHSVIDQFTWGLHLLNETFGECGRPRVGWQIDPFGHSREMASMFAQMGYDGLFFGRLDYQDKRQRLETKSMEMIWQSSANLGSDASDLFTGALYNTYSPPPGFCFDILCADEPIIDDQDSADYNVPRRVDDFFDVVSKIALFYKTNNIILTMGEDFNYQDAHMWYKNLDKIIKYSNDRQKDGSKINVFYSTPSCYLKALYDADITWPTKSDDFFPYSSDPHAFWTGYFTSRPTSKRFERVGNHFLQVCKQLTALATKKEEYFPDHLNLLREVMGIFQHHDAVTGTEKQHVADDYAYLMHRALSACGSNAKNVLNQLVDPPATRKNPKLVQQNNNLKADTFKFETCYYLNISSCSITENSKQFVVTLYNPKAHSGHQYVRLPILGQNFKINVKDYKGVDVSTQIVPIPDSVRELTFRDSDAVNEIVFLANEIPPLGYKSYYVTREADLTEDFIKDAPNVILLQDEAVKFDEEGVLSIGNKFLNISFDAAGFMSSINSHGVTCRLHQTFIYYEGAVGDNEEFKNRSSGAYIFRPNGTEKAVAAQVAIKVFRGEHVEEVHQIFSEYVSQVIRIYTESDHVEFEWMVGPIPIEDDIGKEIVSRFYSSIESDGTFYTDSNGREMLKRVRNHRDTWTLDLQESVSGNYYPVTAKIAIEDKEMRLALLNDRAQGGSSLLDGSLELMLHRRLLHDDAFGVAEALNEQAFGKGLVARGKIYLLFGSLNLPSPTLKARERFLQNQVLLPNWVFLSDAAAFTFERWQNQFNHIYSALSVSLPQSVNLLTFEPWAEDSILIRFEHILEKDEDPEYSKKVTFNLQDLLRSFDISDIKETTLAANQWKEDENRLKFKPDPAYVTLRQNPFGAINPQPTVSEINSGSANSYKIDFEITLEPMQIRTFVMQLEFRP